MAFILYGRGYEPGSNLIGSYPSDVEHRVDNMYVDSITGDIMMNYIDAAGGDDGTIISEPPNGGCRILNLYVDENGRTWASYDGNSV